MGGGGRYRDYPQYAITRTLTADPQSGFKATLELLRRRPSSILSSSLLAKPMGVKTPSLPIAA
jgi:hypothetical protein